MANIVCPVSSERISEQIVRKVALQVTLLSLMYFIIPNFFIPFFLAIDFAIRSFTSLNISLLGSVAKFWNDKFPPNNRQMTDRAPKRFAAGIGFAFSVFILLTFALGIVKTSFVAMGLLSLCAALEAFWGICIGCYVYTFLNLAKYLE